MPDGAGSVSHDFVLGFLTALGVVAVLGAAWILYDSWVEHSDAMRVARWFEDNEMGEPSEDS